MSIFNKKKQINTPDNPNVRQFQSQYNQPQPPITNNVQNHQINPYTQRPPTQQNGQANSPYNNVYNQQLPPAYKPVFPPKTAPNQQGQQPQINYSQRNNQRVVSVPPNIVAQTPPQVPVIPISTQQIISKKPSALKQALESSMIGFIFKGRNNGVEIGDDARVVNSGSDELLGSGLIGAQDFIAPSGMEVDFNSVRINDKYYRTIFAINYQEASPGMLESIVNYEEALDISLYYYPINSADIVAKLRNKISEFEAALNIDLEKGRIPDAYIKVALNDAVKQQELLAAGIEKWFNIALYITVKADTIKELNNITQAILADLAAKEITAKQATLTMEQGFQSTIPILSDKLFKVRNMVTSSASMTFPFTSSDLTMDTGILYGINTYNKSLIVFDRFAMPNANMVILGTSGGGKSYVVKLEALRSLMLGTEVIIIDPEQEYDKLCNVLGGSYISFSQDGQNKVNPFELSGAIDTDDDELKLKQLSLISFFKIALGNVSNSELALLDRAIRQTYYEKGITGDPLTHRNEPPRMEDMYKVLQAMPEQEARSLADRLERFIVGTASGIFDRKTSVDIKNPFTVFSIRELSDELRPLAMYLMLDFIWNKIKRERKKRILIVDEAWILMKYPDSALFINSIAKRARKYYLGLTTITQDVGDFLGSDVGTAIITNSSIQILLKQHPAAIDKLSNVFYLSDGEKQLLLAAGVGQGLFFADNNHVAIEVKSSDHEHRIITTNPAELEKMKLEDNIKIIDDKS